MSLIIWISSFIPANVPGLSRPVPGSPNLAMIPGPLPVSDCFHTDHRGFSTSSAAPARIHSKVEISTADFTLIGETHRCGKTIECDCEDGAVECDKTASSAGLKIAAYQKRPSGCSFQFTGGAGNPCHTFAPEINWLIKVEVKRVGAGVQVAVLPGSLVEPFPAFEMYAVLGGTVKTLFRRSPNPGSDPSDLLNDPTEIVTGTVSF